MIKVKNISNYKVCLVSPDTKTHRTLMPGREIGLTQEVYDELTFDNGFNKLIRCGALKVTGVNAEVAEVIESPFTSVSTEEIRTIYKDKDYTAFTKVIQNASPATKEAMVAIAIEDRIADNAFVSLLKKYCDVDIIEAISVQAKAAE